jgi:hypothetical protein
MVRFVPNPASGEFVNVGAIAGGDDGGDWAVRQISNSARARALGPTASLNALFAFLNDVGDRIDEFNARINSLEPPNFELSESWLTDLSLRRRNIVQLSSPAPVDADSAEDALEVVFEHLINEPAVEHRGYATRLRVFSDLHRSYLRAGIRQDLLHERVRLASGPLQAPIDFAVANGKVYQLAHTWSFQIASLPEVSKEVKAWGYTVQALRNAGGEVIGRDGTTQIAANVDVEVLYAEPTTDAGQEVFAEAEQVFSDVNVRYRPLADARNLADDVARLLVSDGVLDDPNRLV